jgi:hypothetical protein
MASIDSLGDVTAAMRRALAEGKTGEAVVRSVQRDLTEQARKGKGEK